MDIILEQRWTELCRRYCDDQELIALHYGEIVRRYSEPHRAYHTLRHLESLFTDIDRFAPASPRIEFAGWFHDIVYQPGSHSNEAESGRCAERAMTSLGAAQSDIDRVSYMIACTRRHTNPERDGETQLFLDADMAILGAPPSVYQTYVENLREEYKKIPTLLYKRGRRKFIEAVLDEERIFKSEPFFECYEARARINLAGELERLK